MGGPGSGRWQQGRALTTERMSLDIRDMRAAAQAMRLVNWRWSDGTTASVLFCKGLAFLEVRMPGQATVQTQVELDATPLHFGGHRFWWRCPCCRARVAVLYSQRGRWQCRSCAALVHKSTRQDGLFRGYAKVNKVRRALGWGGGMLSPMGTRRKGMHRRSFIRLMNALTEASLALAGGHDTAVEQLTKRLGRIRVQVREAGI